MSRFARDLALIAPAQSAQKILGHTRIERERRRELDQNRPPFRPESADVVKEAIERIPNATQLHLVCDGFRKLDREPKPLRLLKNGPVLHVRLEQMAPKNGKRLLTSVRETSAHH